MSAGKIRALNDASRTTMTGGKVFLTPGVDALPSDTTRTRSTISAHSRSPGDASFGKIDAYDENMEFGSEEPADPSKTSRVLTIMLADEY